MQNSRSNAADVVGILEGAAEVHSESLRCLGRILRLGAIAGFTHDMSTLI